jgi:hypothetical protein
LQEKKVNGKQVYPHITFAKCQQLVKDLVNNRTHYRNKKESLKSGVKNRVGRPNLSYKQRVDVELADKVVAPRIPGHFC